MNPERIIVAAVVLYAVIYLARYALSVMKGKRTGCGCGSENGCPKGDSSPPE